MPKWIKCADKMPDYQIPILARLSTGSYAVLFRMVSYLDPAISCPRPEMCDLIGCVEHWESAIPNYSCVHLDYVTHWMTIPELKEGEKR